MTKKPLYVYCRTFDWGLFQMVTVNLFDWPQTLLCFILKKEIVKKHFLYKKICFCGYFLEVTIFTIIQVFKEIFFGQHIR